MPLRAPSARRVAHDTGWGTLVPPTHTYTHTRHRALSAVDTQVLESPRHTLGAVCVGLFTHLARACVSSRDIPSHPRIRVPGEAARDLLRHAAGRLAPQHFHIHIKALGQATGLSRKTRIDGRELRERLQALPNQITIGSAASLCLAGRWYM